MHSVSPKAADARIRIEIQRSNGPAIGFDVALCEVADLSSLAQASARAMGFSTFVRFNRLQRSPELWLAVALAGLRLGLAPAFDHRAAAAREERLFQQAAANAAVARAARIAAIDRLRAAMAAAWPRLTSARLTAGADAPMRTSSS